MKHPVEVWADITCPFTHVGLKHVVGHVAESGRDVIVRAWPLEWVNGTPLAADAVATKAGVLSEQLGVDDFDGLDIDRWPATTLPALELAAAAYGRDAATGLAVSLALRAAVFEQGLDVSDPEVLAGIAAEHDVPMGTGADAAVRADFDAGTERGVQGSPHFFVGDDHFFCPSLDLGHDDEGHLTARFDPAGLAMFFARVDR